MLQARDRAKSPRSTWRPSSKPTIPCSCRAFWHDLNDKNRRMLEEEGLADFKRTVSQNYFNWLITDRKSDLFRHAFRQWCRRPNLLPLLTAGGNPAFAAQHGRRPRRIDGNAAPHLSPLCMLRLGHHAAA